MLSVVVKAGTGQDCRGDEFYNCLVDSGWNGWEPPFETACAYDT